MAARRRSSDQENKPGGQGNKPKYKSEIKPIGPFGQPRVVMTPVASEPAAPTPVAAPQPARSIRSVERGTADVAVPAKKVVKKTTPKKKTPPKKTGGGKETPPPAEPETVTADDWKQIIQEEFGSMWDVYNESPDVRKVLDDAVKGGYHNDEVKLEAALSNTNWFRSTQASARQFAIRQSTDPATLQAQIDKNASTIKQAALETGIVLPDATITRLSSDAIKYGWSDNQLTNAVGSEVVATAKAGGPSAFAELSRGSTGRRLREIADSYAVKPSDSMIQEWTAKVMSGEQSEDTFTNTVREQARTMYRSLAPQIDKNMDVKTATSAYTSQATRVLGIDETQIDWTDAKWNKALNYQDPKTNEYRAMDTWEWDRYLRSLPEWQNTDDAKNLYRTAAFTLAQAFGRTT